MRDSEILLVVNDDVRRLRSVMMMLFRLFPMCMRGKITC